MNKLLFQAEFPDVVLVKKVYTDTGTRIRRRKWKLKHLDRQIDDDASSAGGDYEDFLQDLEEDPTIREVRMISYDACISIKY